MSGKSHNCHDFWSVGCLLADQRRLLRKPYSPSTNIHQQTRKEHYWLLPCHSFPRPADPPESFILHRSKSEMESNNHHVIEEDDNCTPGTEALCSINRYTQQQLLSRPDNHDNSSEQGTLQTGSYSCTNIDQEGRGRSGRAMRLDEADGDNCIISIPPNGINVCPQGRWWTYDTGQCL